MDVADVFFALSKMLNYLQLQRISEVSFAFFLCIWTYFRHYQNFRILYSVWNEYDVYTDNPQVALWPFGKQHLEYVKYFVFAPIAALQCLNLFWYGLMWRIVYR